MRAMAAAGGQPESVCDECVQAAEITRRGCSGIESMLFTYMA